MVYINHSCDDTLIINSKRQKLVDFPPIFDKIINFEGDHNNYNNVTEPQTLISAKSFGSMIGGICSTNINVTSFEGKLILGPSSQEPGIKRVSKLRFAL